MDIELLQEFEKEIKLFKVLKFDKIWEKNKESWKLIYSLKGFVRDNFYYANIKFIFWLNLEKTNFSEHVVTFLGDQNCDYKSFRLEEDETALFMIEKVLSAIKKNWSYIYLNNLITKGTDIFNKYIKENKIKSFIQSLNYIPDSNTTCPKTSFKFELITNENTINFELRCKENGWMFGIDNVYDYVTKDINELPEKILSKVYGVK